MEGKRGVGGCHSSFDSNFSLSLSLVKLGFDLLLLYEVALETLILYSRGLYAFELFILHLFF